MYHAACKVEFQPFNRSYSQMTFFNFFIKCALAPKIQWCRLTGFEPLDRLSSTNCLSWQPWQGNAWPYSWNTKRHLFSAMFSEQMRYILYFDQYQCRFGGCTHAAFYFSTYYSITAVVSACAFAGFEKKCALSVYILHIFGCLLYTSPSPRD